MHLPNEPFFQESGVHGPMPTFWYGVDAVDGDAYPWISAPAGSVYMYREIGDFAKPYIKLTEAGGDGDWVPLGGVHVIQERVLYSQFTDGAGASGTYTLTNGTIPAGATVLNCNVYDVTGFTGTTTCVLTVGDGTDVDRYNTGTPSIFATAAVVPMGAPSGTTYHSGAKSIVLTATEDNDWGDVTAGALTIRLTYVY